MIIRALAPRQCRRLLFTHGSRTLHSSRRIPQQYDSPAELPSDAVQAEEQAFLASLRSQVGSKPLSQAQPDGPIDDVAKRDPAYEQLQQKEQREARSVDAWNTWNHLRHTTNRLGADTEPFYKPQELIRNPPRVSEVTEELLLASQVHLGHSTSLWHPANSRYIFGVRSGVHIISLDVTAAHLRRAAKVVAGVAEHGGTILFVGTRANQDSIVVRAAQLAGACHIIERWIPGTITNGEQILAKCGVKVVDEFDREITGFADQLLGRGALKPDLVVCLNPPENYVLLHECGLQGIPTIGIVDTDQNPTWVTYPIPANDDSLRSVAVITGVLGRAGEDGQARRKQAAMRGEITFRPAQRLIKPAASKSKDAAAHDDGLMGVTAPALTQGATQTDKLVQPSPTASPTAASASVEPTLEDIETAAEEADKDVSVRRAKKEDAELLQGSSQSGSRVQ